MQVRNRKKKLLKFNKIWGYGPVRKGWHILRLYVRWRMELYYVPAVEQEYIKNMPVWDGSFN